MMRARLAGGCVALLAACSSHRDAADGGVSPPDASSEMGNSAVHADAASPRDATSAPDAQEASASPPTLPVGYAAFRQLGRLPVVRIGQRTYMRSTFDRRGNNDASDASHFVRQERDDFNVTLDTVGPGILAFVRTNHWHGSPWHYVVDGRDFVVSESSTLDPNAPVAGSTFLPAAAFPTPLALTWAETRGADLSYVSIPFTDTLTLAYGRTHYGTGYYIFHRFPMGAENLPAPLSSWTDSDQPPADVRDTLAHAGADPVPEGSATRLLEGHANLPMGANTPLFMLADGPRTIHRLSFDVAAADALVFGRVRLRIYWDGAAVPAVDAPLALFVGAGTLYARSGPGLLVNSLFTRVQIAERVTLDAYFPMPYRTAARVELVGADADVNAVHYSVRTEPPADEPAWLSPFHATFTDIPEPTAGDDLVLLDTRSVEGGGKDYCGVFMGMSWTFSDRARLDTLEGDPRFYFDDSQSPQAQGTGTEEWGGGGDYWGGQTMTLPLVGHPTGAPSADAAKNTDDQIESAYRFLVSDAMPFGKNARITLEHGGTNESSEHYRAVTYWYGVDSPCLVQTDSLHVADVMDAQRHAFNSPDASPVQTLESRFPLGPDLVQGREVFPALTDTGLYTRGESTFTIAIDPANVGVLLRRRLDYGFADQRATVEVADDSPDAVFAPAGTWYTAGSNRCVFSGPGPELGAPSHDIQDSNRRFLEDEFLLPPALTRGRTSIRVRFRYVAQAKPLVPGAALPESAWSEYRYNVYSYLLPAL